MTDQPLSGRIALVTGANHGIGAATAIALARLSAEVVITYLPMADPARPSAYGIHRRQSGAATVDAQLSVDARASALLISELATRHRARGGTWGRIMGLTSGGPMGFPGEVSYGAAKAALENHTMRQPSSSLTTASPRTSSTHPSPTPAGSPMMYAISSPAALSTPTSPVPLMWLR